MGATSGSGDGGNMIQNAVSAKFKEKVSRFMRENEEREKAREEEQKQTSQKIEDVIKRTRTIIINREK